MRLGRPPPLSCFTWNSQVDLDFSAPAQFSNLGNFGATLQSKGLLNPAVEVGIKVPQQLMVSMFHQVNDRWAVLGSLGWQQWSKFGQVQLGIDASSSTSVTPNMDFQGPWRSNRGRQQLERVGEHNVARGRNGIHRVARQVQHADEVVRNSLDCVLLVIWDEDR